MVDLYALVEQSVAGLNVELVDVERAGRGLLKVTIDREGGVRIEDCEAVSRQLSRVFEVEEIDYDRLEVGSPGTDRPLRREADFIRFAGERVEVRLREPFAGRKTYTGILLAPGSMEEEEPEQGGITGAPAAVGEAVFGLELDTPDEGKNKAGGKGRGKAVAKQANKATQGEARVLRFTVDEVERAKLDPVLDFKGKKR